MTSRFQPTRLLTPVLIFILIGAFSYWLNPAPWHHLTLGTKTLFAASFLILLALIAVLRNTMYLRIDDRGLEIKLAIGPPRVYSWDDIEAAHIFKVTFLHIIPLTSSIHLRLSPAARSSNPILKAASAINGAHVSFPAFFDQSAADILEQINFHLSHRTPQ